MKVFEILTTIFFGIMALCLMTVVVGLVLVAFGLGQTVFNLGVAGAFFDIVYLGVVKCVEAALTYWRD